MRRAIAFGICLLLSGAAVATPPLTLPAPPPRLPPVCEPVQAYLKIVTAFEADRGALSDCSTIANRLEVFGNGIAKRVKRARGILDQPGTGQGQSGAIGDASEALEHSSAEAGKLSEAFAGADKIYLAQMAKADKRIKALLREQKRIQDASGLEANGQAVLAFRGLRARAGKEHDRMAELSQSLAADSVRLSGGAKETKKAGEALASVDVPAAEPPPTDDQPHDSAPPPESAGPGSPKGEAELADDEKKAALRDPGGGKGGNAERSPEDYRPASGDTGISKNLLVGLAGGAVITAGAVGGLYWVTQKAIATANEDAAARINQAHLAANDVIANAEGAVTRIIQLAKGSANQIIADARRAGEQIVSQATANVNALIAKLTTELKNDFVSLTDSGLQKFYDEMQALFQTLTGNAQKAGNTALRSSLGQAWGSVYGEFSSEFARRGLPMPKNALNGGGTGSSTGTSTSTSTSTSTGTGTGTSTSTGS